VRLKPLAKEVPRLGIAGNYGLDSAGIRLAAELGVRYWVWTPRMRKMTAALKPLLRADREQHVVAMMGTAYSAGMVRRGVEKALRLLGTDHLDIYQVSWLGRGSFFTPAMQQEMADLRRRGLVRAIGCSIHDRRRAGQLAADSILDLLMIRYNAKHPGAEADIFPHLQRRNPIIVAYTATSWRQLLRPLKGLDLPPPPASPAFSGVPPLSASLCYRFCLSSPHVDIVLSGPANEAQLRDNLAALEAGPLTPEEDAWVRAYGARVKARKRLPYI
jgi:aryl-alcohol dehydrogenase-like predicted oxidoreductase